MDDPTPVETAPDTLTLPEAPAPEPLLEILDLAVTLTTEAVSHPRFEKPLQASVREARLLNEAPWVRPLGRLAMEVSTNGWRFPTPLDGSPPKEEEKKLRLFRPEATEQDAPPETRTRLRPPNDAVLFKDRLLYLLQPPLEDIFAGKQVQLPFPLRPYQMQGVAFMMPRHSVLLADEMGLGKTVQIIVSVRLLLQAGMLERVLIVAPKPLVTNWTREMTTWASDMPFEVVGGDTAARRACWFASKAPVKLVNYELLTRDAALVADERVKFDLVVLDEAQRIKNRGSRTAEVVKSIRRDRSWAMSGTPIENRTDDLVNIFDFVDPHRIPPETPARMLPSLVRDCILRRVKEDVAKDMPPKVIQDVFLELSPAQRETYNLAEKEGVVRLNALGDTISVQHVFELVMRLKQICNFDPLTGNSAKLDQLVADMAEVAENNRKAIVFSQWVEPLEAIAKALQPFGPLLYHGKIAHKDRQPILDQFKRDPKKHVILMSYGTGSVGLNLQFTNYVFLFDRWWNPAIEDQAINRAHRLGQKETVFVKRFISQDTIEGRIAEVLEKKRELFNELIAQNGPPVQMGLTEDEIFGLFEIEARPKRAA